MPTVKSPDRLLGATAGRWSPARVLVAALVAEPDDVTGGFVYVDAVADAVLDHPHLPRRPAVLELVLDLVDIAAAGAVEGDLDGTVTTDRATVLNGRCG